MEDKKETIRLYPNYVSRSRNPFFSVGQEVIRNPQSGLIEQQCHSNTTGVAKIRPLILIYSNQFAASRHVPL